MNIIKNISKILGVSLFGLFSACSDYLDVSSELSESLDKDKVFSTASYLKKWYGQIYNFMPNYSETGVDVQYGSSNNNAWAIYSGELVCAHPSALKYGQDSYTPMNTAHNRWKNCYQCIRQAMIFLQNAPEMLGDPKDTSGYISTEEMRRFKADATYMLAYLYFTLFEVYGPVPIINEPADPEVSNIDYPRASVDEMVGYIDNLLASLIEGEYQGALPETLKTSEGDYNLREILRPTMGAVYALRARLWVYAASPLYNGGFPEAVQLRDNEGKQIFPEKDDRKWQTAKERLEDLLRYAEHNNMGLYKAAPDKEGFIDPNKSVYELFQAYNDEILWANGNNDYNDGVKSKMEMRTTPGGIPYGAGNVGFYQNIIDLFHTNNGLDINEDPDYKENGFGDLVNVCNEKQHKDKHIFYMYHNREPRFYADVTYEGKSWHKQLSAYPDFGFYTSKGGAGYRDNTMYARGGYLLYKFNNRTLLNEGSNPTDWGRPWIYFRLADFYLYYAEVCNEIDEKDPNIIKYLDLVRERAGIPGYKELAEKAKAGSKYGKDIIGDKELQREAIYRERIIEMLGEGNYYFDMHRWMRAGWTQDVKTGKWLRKDNEDKQIPRYGMDKEKPSVLKYNDKNNTALEYSNLIGEGSFYNRIVIDQYPWSKAMLFYPIPYNEMQKSRLIVQNPLWD